MFSTFLGLSWTTFLYLLVFSKSTFGFDAQIKKKNQSMFLIQYSRTARTPPFHYQISFSVPWWEISRAGGMCWLVCLNLSTFLTLNIKIAWSFWGCWMKWNLSFLPNLWVWKCFVKDDHIHILNTFMSGRNNIMESPKEFDIKLSSEHALESTFHMVYYRKLVT